MVFVDSLGKRQTCKKAQTSTRPFLHVCGARGEVSELSSGAARICTITSKRTPEWGGGGGRGGSLCVCPAKYFLHYTANPISSFRKLCNVNSRAPFREQPANACPELPFFSLHVKCTQEDFLPLKNALLPPCPCTSKTLLPLPLATPKQGNWLVQKLGEIPGTK